eukprot:c13639_g1_i1 orf=224-538(-)
MIFIRSPHWVISVVIEYSEDDVSKHLIRTRSNPIESAHKCMRCSHSTAWKEVSGSSQDGVRQALKNVHSVGAPVVSISSTTDTLSDDSHLLVNQRKKPSRLRRS